MGTVVSLDVENADARDSDIEALTSVFARLEARFSLYREDSELSRVARGELSLTRASDELRAVYESAMEWRTATSGSFTPNRPDGVIDLDGIVKAIAIRDAGDLLIARGFIHWCLNVGGDVLVSGSPWKVGIVDPEDRAALLCAVELRGRRTSLATSGTSERGEHVWRSDAAGSFVQVSVCADDIVTADVLATAILSGGRDFLDEATERWDIDALTVTASGELAMSPGMNLAG
jgi:thiamine biosynthesis lipoprotein